MYARSLALALLSVAVSADVVLSNRTAYAGQVAASRVGNYVVAAWEASGSVRGAIDQTIFVSVGTSFGSTWSEGEPLPSGPNAPLWHPVVWYDVSTTLVSVVFTSNTTGPQGRLYVTNAAFNASNGRLSNFSVPIEIVAAPSFALCDGPPAGLLLACVSQDTTFVLDVANPRNITVRAIFPSAFAHGFTPGAMSIGSNVTAVIGLGSGQRFVFLSSADGGYDWGTLTDGPELDGVQASRFVLCDTRDPFFVYANSAGSYEAIFLKPVMEAPYVVVEDDGVVQRAVPSHTGSFDWSAVVPSGHDYIALGTNYETPGGRCIIYAWNITVGRQTSNSGPSGSSSSGDTGGNEAISIPIIFAIISGFIVLLAVIFVLGFLKQRRSRMETSDYSAPKLGAQSSSREGEHARLL